MNSSHKSKNVGHPRKPSREGQLWATPSFRGRGNLKNPQWGYFGLKEAEFELGSGIKKCQATPKTLPRGLILGHTLFLGVWHPKTTSKWSKNRPKAVHAALRGSYGPKKTSNWSKNRPKADHAALRGSY